MASIGLSVTVSEILFVSRSYVRLNLKNPREKLKFQTASNRNLVNIEYLRAPAITSTANIFINDRSFNLVGNQIFEITPDKIGALISYLQQLQAISITEVASKAYLDYGGQTLIQG